MGPKSTQQDFFKLYHAGGNFRTVMNSNIIHSPNPAATTSNSNLMAPVTNNPPPKKVGASIHIITESPTRQQLANTLNSAKNNNLYIGGQSSSAV